MASDRIMFSSSWPVGLTWSGLVLLVSSSRTEDSDGSQDDAQVQDLTLLGQRLKPLTKLTINNELLGLL